MKSIALFALFAFCAAAKSLSSNALILEWPFYALDDDLYANISMGTPAQTVAVSLYYFQTGHDLQVVPKMNGGDYDQKASSSWIQIGRVYDGMGRPIGVRCYENFMVANRNFEVTFIQQNPPFTYKAHLGFNLNHDDNSFWRQLLPKLPEQVITIAFEAFPKSGAITLGGLDKKRCYNDWRIVNITRWNTPQSESVFGVKVDKLSAGKYTFTSPGNILFNLNDELTRWPKDVYYSLVKALGSIDGKTVPCDTKTVIDFQIRDINITLTPEEYLDRDQEKLNGHCLLSGVTVDHSKEYSFPRSIFKKHCMSINHSKNEIGLSTRRN